MIAELLQDVTLYKNLGMNASFEEWSLSEKTGVVEIAINGSLTQDGFNINVPSEDKPLPDYLTTDLAKIKVQISEYIINQAIYGLFVSGLNNVTINSDIIPPSISSLVKLNTQFMNGFFPGLVD